MPFVPIVIPTHRTVVSAQVTVRVPFRCAHCGLERVASVVGKGSGSTRSTPAFLPTPQAGAREHMHAREAALWEARTLLSLAVCPECGRRDEGSWAAFRRGTRIFQGIVAALGIALLAAVGSAKEPAIVVICAVPGALVVFVVGYLRGLRVDAAKERVRFLSQEDLEAEKAAEARAIARAAAREEDEDDARAAARAKRAENRRARLRKNRSNE